MATSKNSYGWTTPEPKISFSASNGDGFSDFNAGTTNPVPPSSNVTQQAEFDATGRPDAYEPVYTGGGAYGNDAKTNPYAPPPGTTSHTGGTSPPDGGYTRNPAGTLPDGQQPPDVADQTYSGIVPLDYESVPGKYPPGISDDERSNTNSWMENVFLPSAELNLATQDSATNKALGEGNLAETTRANQAAEINQKQQLEMAWDQWFGEGGAQDQAWASMDLDYDKAQMQDLLARAGIKSGEDMQTQALNVDLSKFNASERRAFEEFTQTMTESARQFDVNIAEGQADRGQALDIFTSGQAQELGMFEAAQGQQGDQFTRTEDRMDLEMEQKYGLDVRGMDINEKMAAAEIADKLAAQGISARGMTLAELQEANRYADSARDFTEGTRQFDKSATEIARQFDVTTEQGQAQFDAAFGEGARQFDLTTAEGQRQFDAQFGETARQFNEAMQQQSREFDVTAGLQLQDLNRQEMDTASIIAQRLHSQGVETRGMNLAELQRADSMQEQNFRQGFDVTQADRQYGIAQGELNIQQQLANLQGAKTGAEVEQIQAQIADMLFSQGIDSRGMSLQETLGASTIADRLASQGIDVRGMDLAELQRQDSMQNQYWQQDFQNREMQQQAMLAQQSMRSQELQARYGAFGRAQGPSTQFLRNW